MKRIFLVAMFLLNFIACKRYYEIGTSYPIHFSPKEVTLPSVVDTVLVTANKGYYLNIIIEQDSPYPILRNSTRDTMERGWIKAVALKDPANTLKIITLENNNSGKCRSCEIEVLSGSSYGGVDVTQLSN